MAVDYQYAAKRCLHAIPTVFIVTVVVFLLVHLIPGSPARAILGTQTTPEAVARVEAELGLDEPLYIQYIDWVSGLLVGDLGYSYQLDLAVTGLLASRFAVTFHLIFWTALLTILLSFPIGILSALKKDSWFDNTIVVTSTLGISLPELVSGVVFLQLFAVLLGWFPTTGFVGPTDDFVGYFQHITLPVLALTIPSVAVVLRMTRSSFWESLQQDFARFFRANGLPEATIRRRVLKKSLIPILTIFGIHFGYMLAGAVVIEQLFSLPGIGELLVSGTRQRDIPVVQGTVLVIAVWFILINLVTDLLVEHFDPRIKGDH